MATNPNPEQEMSLEERRRAFMGMLAADEESFSPGTISAGYLDFFKYLQSNTDLFDPVMVKLQLDLGDTLKLAEDEMKEVVRTYLASSE